jgi:ethanolamine utilization cobalamin adenosyltransferase
MIKMHRDEIYKEVTKERGRHIVWKDYNIQSFHKMRTLAREEFLEAHEAYLDRDFDNVKRELIQVISLIVSYLEGLD